jgi:hypothetical protein
MDDDIIIMPPTENDKYSDGMRAITGLLTASLPYKLTAECIWSAMRYLQNNKDATIEDACNYGINEWIK